MELKKLGIRVDNAHDGELRANSEQALVVVVLSTATIAVCAAFARFAPLRLLRLLSETQLLAASSIPHRSALATILGNAMRSDWDLTPFETVLIVAAAAAMAGGLWAVAG